MGVWVLNECWLLSFRYDDPDHTAEEDVEYTHEKVPGCLNSIVSKSACKQAIQNWNGKTRFCQNRNNMEEAYLLINQNSLAGDIASFSDVNVAHQSVHETNHQDQKNYRAEI